MLQLRKLKPAIKRAAGRYAWAWIVDGYIVTRHFVVPLSSLTAGDRALLANDAALAAAAGLKNVNDSPPSVEGVRAAGKDAVRRIEQAPATTYARTTLLYDMPSTGGTARLYRCAATGLWTGFDDVYLAALGDPETMYLSAPERVASPDPDSEEPAALMPASAAHVHVYLNTEAPVTIAT